MTYATRCLVVLALLSPSIAEAGATSRDYRTGFVAGMVERARKECFATVKTLDESLADGSLLMYARKANKFKAADRETDEQHVTAAEIGEYADVFERKDAIEKAKAENAARKPANTDLEAGRAAGLALTCKVLPHTESRLFVERVIPIASDKAQVAQDPNTESLKKAIVANWSLLPGMAADGACFAVSFDLDDGGGVMGYPTVDGKCGGKGNCVFVGHALERAVLKAAPFDGTMPGKHSLSICAAAE